MSTTHLEVRTSSPTRIADVLCQRRLELIYVGVVTKEAQWNLVAQTAVSRICNLPTLLRPLGRAPAESPLLGAQAGDRWVVK
jgi:hypothetical protein